MKTTRRRVLTAALMLCGSMASFGQADAEQFTLATLNVDGLPQKISFVKVNSDGPGDIGTARIAKYLAKKGYDLLLLQEDFNFHGVLSVWLEDDYEMDEWSGDVGLDGHSIDFLHLQNHRFACDGLMACWKNDLQVTPGGRTAWRANFGKFSHANDEMVTKGYRRYDVTLRGGEHLLVYNMHMDATLDADEAEAKDGPDHEARMAQWAQLREDVLQHLDSQPIIVTGDLNSLYGRDDVKGEFIDAINATGLATASDVWVELQRQGVYPTATTVATAGEETLDKILYINPSVGTSLRPVAVSTDREGYLHEGMPLGDHWPVAATFRVVRSAGPGESVGIVGVSESGHERAGESIYYNLNGQRIGQPQNGIVIEQQGTRTGKRIIK